MKTQHLWTKEEIKTVIELWSQMNMKEIAAKLNLKENQVGYMANQIRKSGHILPKKHKVGYIRNLINEVISELK